jgi:ferrochelatase
MPDTAPYDAVLIVSFGGPERPEDVVPFLRNVTAGKDIPTARLEQVGEHYFGFGGRSPLNDINRAFIAAVRGDLRNHVIDLPVYWGNRNWDPYLADAVREMRDDGVKRAACFVTSAYSSYSGCRQYRENLAAAAAAIDDAPRLDRLRAYFGHPGFIEANISATRDGIDALPADLRERAHLVFVTHSIPLVMNAGSGRGGGAYVAQHEAVVDVVSRTIAERTGRTLRHSLAYCSRSGSPHVPWLEPDVNDHLEALAADGVEAVVVVPVGFVADHMEVIYYLDTEARATADRLGLVMQRARTAGLDPRFVAVVRDLLLERAAVERGESPDIAAVRGMPIVSHVCAADCCPHPQGEQPAIGQEAAAPHR